MNLALPIPSMQFNGRSSTVSTTPGISEPADRIRQLATHISIHLKDNASSDDRQSQVIDSLLSIYSECLEDNWDGYGADQVEPSALNAAMKFAESLSPSIPTPELRADPDGEIALEWFGDNNSVMSISVGAGEDINYSAIFPDQHKVNGTESLYAKDKGIIETYIKRVAR